MLFSIINRNFNYLNKLKYDKNTLSKLNHFLRVKMDNKIVIIINDLKSVYQKYGDTVSLLRVWAYIMNGNILRVQKIYLEERTVLGKSIELPIGDSYGDKIIFFNPQVIMKNTQNDSFQIKKLLEKVILLS